ncbi:hypothetical protein C8Q77DRAFT_1153492 [Trametes polyzona]|nr:hypothetical protein C8Q77DRAFT_1153492 [Trametes polyzona]
MPRLFPSLGRSSKGQGHGAYEPYEGYDAAPHGYYDYGYQEQEPRQNRSPWSKVLGRKSNKRNQYMREDPGVPMLTNGSGYRTTVEDYPEDPHGLHGAGPPTDDESFEELLSRSGRHSDSAVPLVQRESSLTRLQQAFADHGTYAPALSAAPSMSMYASAPGPQPRAASVQPHVSAVNNMHQPAMVVDGALGGGGVVPMQGLRPDIVHHAASYPSGRERERERRRHHRERERERSAPPRSYRDHPAYWEEPLEPSEDPPVVVVVEHGRHGKKDKYYIIPGGAPVIFEDERGNELTRVGDFSGRYKPPRRPRPVIVQDQYGNEICRAGFSSDDHISVGSRDNYSHHTGGSSRSDRRGRTTQHRGEDRGHGSHHGSSHSSRRNAPDSYHYDSHYQPSRPREASRSPRQNPEVYYIDPTKQRSVRSHGSSSDTLVRSSPRDHHSSSGRSHDRTREYRDAGSDRGRERERERERAREYERERGRDYHRSEREYERDYRRRP